MLMGTCRLSFGIHNNVGKTAPMAFGGLEKPTAKHDNLKPKIAVPAAGHFSYIYLLWGDIDAISTLQSNPQQ